MYIRINLTPGVPVLDAELQIRTVIEVLEPSV